MDSRRSRKSRSISVGLKSSRPLVAPTAQAQIVSQRPPRRPPTYDPHPDLGSSVDHSTSSPQKQDPWAPSTPDSLPATTSTTRPDTAKTTDSQAHSTFLIMEDELQDEYLHGIRRPISVSAMSEPASDEAGSSFDELIDRLLALPMTKQDTKFVPTFLCLHRKFSSPGQVFSAFTLRFDHVERSHDPQLIKATEQLRYLQVLGQWTRNYPGDFAQPLLKKEIMAFVSRLEKSRVFAYAAREISIHLELATRDEDAEWGRFESLESLPEARESIHSQSGGRSPSVRTEKSSHEEILKFSKQTSRGGSSEDVSWKSATPSVALSSVRSSNPSSQSPTAVLGHDEARQEAQKLVCVPRTRLSKIQWHRFVEVPDHEIARELTRIDWIFYASIRPRDLVLHISLANSANKSSKNPENVQRMVEHFNHLCCFVSSTILLRDKPKHRARVLEKWMTIAWKVRYLNNYNTLGSIVAGTNSTAVHRLMSTWELVPEQTRKDYMRLTMLMGTIRSHGAYRLAWENSFSERIPFLPVYQKDLVAAESANRTFVGSQRERINWKKFEVMGEVISSMQKSQEKPYKLPKSEDVMKLVLQTKITEDSEDLAEELYERSLQVEPNGVGETSRKKFEWLRR